MLGQKESGGQAAEGSGGAATAAAPAITARSSQGSSSFDTSEETKRLMCKEGLLVIKQGIRSCLQILEGSPGISEDETKRCFQYVSEMAEKGSWCWPIYDVYKEELQNCIIQLDLPLMGQAPNIMKELMPKWTNYSNIVRSITSFLSPMESMLVEHNLPSLHNAASTAFYEKVFASLDQKYGTVALLWLIHQIRDEKKVDVKLLKSIADGLSRSFGQGPVEQTIINEVKSFYLWKKSGWTEQLSTDDYNAKVKSTLEEEAKMLKLMDIRPNRAEDILKVMRHVLMKDYRHGNKEFSKDSSLAALSVDLVGNALPNSTGYSGIVNQGATCHLNCVLQILYHIPIIRKAIVEVVPVPLGGVANELKRLFCNMANSTVPVSAKKVTAALGWSEADCRVHRDLEEQCTILLEKLETELKDTHAKQLIRDLFEGHIEEKCRWINVEKEKSLKDTFRVIHLEVSEFSDVYSSLDKIVFEEWLENHRDEDSGIVSGYRKKLFSEFPPCLLLNLRRSVFDYSRQRSVKINDRYEFPLYLNLDRDDGSYLSFEADRSRKNMYTLHSVIAHSGSADLGHYHVYIQPNLAHDWISFNDENAAVINESTVLESLFGGGPSYASCASMLLYIRQEDQNDLFVIPQEINSEEKAQSNTNTEIVVYIPPSFQQGNFESSEEIITHELPKLKIGRLASFPVYYTEKIFSSLLPNFSVKIFLKNFLRCDLMLELLIVYSGFHLTLFFIDWVVEMGVKQKFWKTTIKDVTWFLALLAYLAVLRLHRLKHHYKAKPVPSIFDIYGAVTGLTKKRQEQKSGAAEKVSRLKISASQKRREADSDMCLVIILNGGKLVYDVVKDLTESSKDQKESGHKMPWLIGRAVSHACAVVVEVIGSYLVRYLCRTKGAPLMVDSAE